MSILTSEQRRKLSDSDFALPGRRYPIHDEAHARDALARAADNATPAERVTIRKKVAARYPNIKQAKNPYKPGTLNHLMHSAN